MPATDRPAADRPASRPALPVAALAAATQVVFVEKNKRYEIDSGAAAVGTAAAAAKDAAP